MTTILAVDDSATMRKCLEISFQGTGINLVSCQSASDALAKVKALSPDLVIADVSLPPSDGYDLCATLKLTAPQVPVLMLSSKQFPFDPGRGAKADGHLDKPFDTQQLIDKARELIATAPQKRPTVDTDVPSTFGGSPEPAREHRPPSTPAPRPVTMPERGAPAGGWIPPPGQRRPTPAMVPADSGAVATPAPTPSPPPVATQPHREPLTAQQRAAVARKTVPFAIPSPLLGKTSPGFAAAPEVPGAAAPGAAALGRADELGKTMTLPGKMEAAMAQALHADMGPPRQGRTTSPGVQAPTRTGTLPGVTPAEEDEALPPTAQPATVSRTSPSARAPGAAVHGNGADFEARLTAMGLTPDQVAGVLAISREVIEQVVWEVVPTLAETIIKEELKRLTES